MDDTKLINLIAEIWVANGGDVDGLEFCWIKIRNRVEDIIEERETKGE